MRSLSKVTNKKTTDFTTYFRVLNFHMPLFRLNYSSIIGNNVKTGLNTSTGHRTMIGKKMDLC